MTTGIRSGQLQIQVSRADLLPRVESEIGTRYVRSVSSYPEKNIPNQLSCRDTALLLEIFARRLMGEVLHIYPGLLVAARLRRSRSPVHRRGHNRTSITNGMVVDYISTRGQR